MGHAIGTVELRGRRVKLAARVEAAQQALSVFMLFLAVRDRLRTAGPGDVPIAVAQLIAGILLLVAIARDLRGHDTGGVSWSNVLAGGLLGLEWLDRYEHGGKIWSPVLLTALASIFVGLFHARLHSRRQRRRRIVVDGETLDYRYALRRFRVAWRDLREIVADDSRLDLHTIGGRTHTIRVGRLDNGAEVSATVLRAAGEQGVTVRSSRTVIAADEEETHHRRLPR
jgi:hypothetical protein